MYLRIENSMDEKINKHRNDKQVKWSNCFYNGGITFRAIVIQFLSDLHHSASTSLN